MHLEALGSAGDVNYVYSVAVNKICPDVRWGEIVASPQRFLAVGDHPISING